MRWTEPIRSRVCLALVAAAGDGDQPGCGDSRDRGLQAALRNTHLKYHLLTSGLLTAAQLQRYSELRGYVDEDIGHQHRPNIELPECRT